jgi:hypothetical protein
MASAAELNRWTDMGGKVEDKVFVNSKGMRRCSLLVLLRCVERDRVVFHQAKSSVLGKVPGSSYRSQLVRDVTAGRC